jgi:hypothetical protein
MSDEKIIQLPARDEMLRRLIKVDDRPHPIERFYPLILEHAGEKLSGPGVVMMLLTAMGDYTNGLPPKAFKLLMTRFNEFVKALVDDQEALAAAFEVSSAL